MKAKVNDKVKLLKAKKSGFSDRIVPANSTGVIVESYTNPEGYAVDFPIPDKNLVGGFTYENLLLYPDEFTVVKPE